MAYDSFKNASSPTSVKLCKTSKTNDIRLLGGVPRGVARGYEARLTRPPPLRIPEVLVEPFGQPGGFERHALGGLDAPEGWHKAGVAGLAAAGVPVVDVVRAALREAGDDPAAEDGWHEARLPHLPAVDVHVGVVVDQGEGGLRGDEARLAEALAVWISLAGTGVQKQTMAGLARLYLRKIRKICSGGKSDNQENEQKISPKRWEVR